MTVSKEEKESVNQSKSFLTDTVLFTVPNITLCQLIFDIQSSSSSSSSMDHPTSQTAKSDLMKLVNDNGIYIYPFTFHPLTFGFFIDMAPFYKYLCDKYGWSMDSSLLKDMEARNAKVLGELETKCGETRKTLGDTDVFGVLVEKAIYLCRIGDKASLKNVFPRLMQYSFLGCSSLCPSTHSGECSNHWCQTRYYFRHSSYRVFIR
jgi:hypothetical protein